MYLCKRKANKFRNLATIIFLNITILGCSFSPINFDSQINVFDLFYALDIHYGFYPQSPPADYNEDSLVNFQDIMAYIYNIMNYNR